MQTISNHTPNCAVTESELHAKILRDLQCAITRLAATVDDHAPIAGALRRFAARLPTTPEPPSHSSRRLPPMRDLLYHALDEGTLDPDRFDWLMLADNRARRQRSRTQPR